MKNILKHYLRNFFFFLDLNVTEKTESNKIKNFLKKFRPYDLGYNLIRVGGKNDGGYIVPDILDNITTCISPGVGHTNSFEKELQSKGINSFLIDHTIEQNSPLVKDFDFTKKKLNNFDDEKNITLDKICLSKLNNNDRPILQMDIEGDEYLNIFITSDLVLNKFEIMVIEFHYLDRVVNKEICILYDKVLSKILKNFDVCHIHPNNGPRTFRITKNLTIPQILEVTFLNKRLTKYKKPIISLPNELDCKCDEKKPDIFLDNFFFEK